MPYIDPVTDRNPRRLRTLRTASRGCVVRLVLLVTWPFASAFAEEAPLEFNRDIRPLLANYCFACHGPDEKQLQADLRLDHEESALSDRGGHAAVVPGSSQQSELVRRITAVDPDDRMPPARFGKSLSPVQIERLRRWVDEGAKWQPHWSLVVPVRRGPPPTDSSWVNNPIDAFIWHGLAAAGLEPAPRADARVLLRRLSFDLTGLPPDSGKNAASLVDPAGYSAGVEQILASQHFGERMAGYWLDLVRYADTNGIHGDNHREITLYRDYVINGFNANKPFDEFTVEQLAGDLLDGATEEQRVASGYNRLLMTTREGGAQAKEYRAKYAADRVRNASAVWLGATLGCAECHDHKFDPYTTKEFYQFAAFFADVEETAVGSQKPTLFPSEAQAAHLAAFDEQTSRLQAILETSTAELEKAQRLWERKVLEGLANAAEDKRPKLPKEVVAALEKAGDKRSEEENGLLAKHYRSIAPLLEETRNALAEAQKGRRELEQRIPKTLISMRMAEPRVTRVLPRGNWLDDNGEEVEPSVPSVLPALAVEGRANRLDLARWLVRSDNPMVARVFVNRLWKLVFGHGIVSSLDDFGAQGTWPTHPELLDWLALEFVDSGWNVKHMLRLMVNSSTYQQSSAADAALLERDPFNHLYARQSRFRLDAEMVRDNALAVSGLLTRTVGGPSAKPYQPAGYWAHLNFPKRQYQHDSGKNLYRRGLYTYWCRTFLHPSLLAFDAPTREECAVERPRSNTPQQALVLLNDPVYVEAARALAMAVLSKGGESAEDRVRFAYRRVLQRRPSPAETDLLIAIQGEHLEQYRSAPEAAKLLLAVGALTTPEDLPPVELASWMSVTRVLLNLHETITRN